MITIPQDKNTIVAVYNSADKPAKDVLHQIFGDKFFLSAMERIRSWEDAAAEKGLDPVTSLPYPTPRNAREEAANAFIQLDIIAECLCDGVVLDYTNKNQKKWGPVFYDYTPGSGFRFRVSAYDWAATFTFGGARLCVPEKIISDYFGTQFLPIWNKFLNPNK